MPTDETARKLTPSVQDDQLRSSIRSVIQRALKAESAAQAEVERLIQAISEHEITLPLPGVGAARSALEAAREQAAEARRREIADIVSRVLTEFRIEMTSRQPGKYKGHRLTTAEASRRIGDHLRNLDGKPLTRRELSESTRLGPNALKRGLAQLCSEGEIRQLTDVKPYRYLWARPALQQQTSGAIR